MSTYENSTGRLAPQSLLQQRYIIVGQAGRGGMGAVYEAVDTRIGNRRVAIKEMSQGQLSEAELVEATTRFQHEARLLGSLHHPNLPGVSDAFSERGRSYLVMDFIDGKTLLQLLKEFGGRPLAVEQVLHYARQLCDVLSYLHSKRPPIIFRDVKPSNIMITANGRVFLIDFGIARIFKEGQEQDTVFLGSPGYAPPEQHGTSQTNPRSDLYSLGATLYYCLTGNDPYYAKDRFFFPPIRQTNPQVPMELDQLIQRMVALDERQRPVSAAEVQQALIRISQQSIEATGGLAPSTAANYVSLASAPTQYSTPAPTPAPLPTTIQSPVRPASAATNIPTTSPVMGQAAAALPVQPQAKQDFASLWTRPFMTFFGLILVLTIGISLVVLNVVNKSDHVVELALSLLFVLVAAGMGSRVRGILPRSALLLSALAVLVSGFTFATQALNDFASLSILNPPLPNQLLTLGLAAAAIISLAWLAQSFSLVHRAILLIVFGAAVACAFVQYNLSDFNTPGNSDGDIKHTLLIVVLILLTVGTLLATQMERVRKAS